MAWLVLKQCCCQQFKKVCTFSPAISSQNALLSVLYILQAGKGGFDGVSQLTEGQH
jgi:hypothetical protein